MNKCPIHELEEIIPQYKTALINSVSGDADYNEYYEWVAHAMEEKIAELIDRIKGNG